MNDPPRYHIGLDPGRSQDCIAVAIVVEERVWIDPNSEGHLVVLRNRQRSNGRP